MTEAPLRVALLATGHGREVAELTAVALRECGHDARVLDPPAETPLDRAAARILRARGFPEELAALPRLLRALHGRDHDVAHAFSPEAAAAALLWRRRSSGPVVFAPGEPLVRERLSDRRLRLRLVEAAIADSDAVVAPSEESRAALSRWLAVDAPLLAPHDAAGHERVYLDLLGRRAS